MALIMQQEERRGSNWFAVFVFFFLFAVILGGGYFLFFSATPGIEIIAPTSLQKTEAISQATIDSSRVINNPVLKTFREYGTVPSIGTIGRSNPFIAP